MTEPDVHGTAQRASGAVSAPPPLAAERIFGDRLAQAVAYAGMLADTGISHGLVGPREAPRLWDRHILNCAVVADLISPGSHVADIGSGAGLPGLVLAIARPDLTLTLIEPLARRASWLRRAVADLDLARVTVLEGRAEFAARAVEVDVVTARAVASIERLAAWGLPLLAECGVILALKGSSAADELRKHRPGLLRLGVRDATVVQCGVGVVDPPTTLIRLMAGSLPRRASDGRAPHRTGRAPRPSGVTAREEERGERPPGART